MSERTGTADGIKARAAGDIRLDYMRIDDNS